MQRRLAEQLSVDAKLAGTVGSAGIGYHLPLLGLVRSAGSVGPTGAVGVAALIGLLAVGVAAVGALGAAGDRPGAGAGLGGVAFAVQLHHHPGAEYRVVLGAPYPLGQLLTRPRPNRELTMVERHNPGSRLGVADRPVR
jgi:hypothetical protein